MLTNGQGATDISGSSSAGPVASVSSVPAYTYATPAAETTSSSSTGKAIGPVGVTGAGTSGTGIPGYTSAGNGTFSSPTAAQPYLGAAVKERDNTMLCWAFTLLGALMLF